MLWNWDSVATGRYNHSGYKSDLIEIAHYQCIIAKQKPWLGGNVHISAVICGTVMKVKRCSSILARNIAITRFDAWWLSVTTLSNVSKYCDSYISDEQTKIYLCSILNILILYLPIENKAGLSWGGFASALKTVNI